MGLIPGAGGAYYLPRIVGVAKALELFWSCDPVDADEAARIGLVNRVFDDERLAEETQAFAARIARGAPLAVRLVKKLIYQGLTSDLSGALDLVASNMPVVRLSADHKEAVAAYREKREPVFAGS
jgi:2-(1,2-epoxy-1,2-dihydrophenyl)acetyl-CoA isomerase